MIGERHNHPALAGLSQIEGVTQEAAVSLTSNHTQPAAGQPFSGRRFVVSTAQYGPVRPPPSKKSIGFRAALVPKPFYN